MRSLFTCLLLVGMTGSARAQSSEVLVTKTDRTIEIRVGDKPVLVYNHAVVPSDDPKEPFYRRSGFIHPVYDPQGNVVTDGMPPDHMHQHGLMFAWVDTSFQDRAVDFWNSAKHQGTVRHAGIKSIESGKEFGRFVVELEHVDLTAGPNKPEASPPGVVVLRETWQVTVYNRADGFLFDLASEQRCAGDDPLVINKYHYGGMMFRGARHWGGASGCTFLTSEGHDRKAGNHTRAWWCDLSGPSKAESKEEVLSGVTIFCSSQNFRAPQHVRLHPTMPYWVWSPMVEKPFTIEPGKPYKSEYRYFVHAGKLDAEEAERISRDYRQNDE